MTQNTRTREIKEITMIVEEHVLRFPGTTFDVNHLRDRYPTLRRFHKNTIGEVLQRYAATHNLVTEQLASGSISVTLNKKDETDAD